MNSRILTNSLHVIRRFSSDGAIEQPRQSLRQIVDSMLQGKPVNSSVRTHKPLPPDGESLDDFETGTREVNDLADLQKLSDEVQAVQSELSKAQAEQKASAERKAFEDAVNAELAKRQRESSDL